MAVQGFFKNFNALPPRPVLTILLPLPFVLIIAFSKGFKRILLATPPQWLVFFQSFRILVELLLWRAFINGLLPVQMTFEGRNWDILAGLLALPAGWALTQNKPWARTAAVVYNIIGIGLLLNILVIALLSMPMSFRYFMNEPANVIVGTFPFIYLPAVLVVLAYSFHIFSLRQLWLLRKEERDTKATERYPAA